MSLHGSPTLTIDIAARRGERVIVVAIASFVALALSQLNLSMVLLAIAGVGALMLVVGGFAALGWIGGERRLERIVCQPDGRWVLHDAGGRTLETTLTNGSRAGGAALWLCWTARRHAPVLLLPGDISPGDFRRLLVRLRVAPFPTPNAQQEIL